MVPRLGVIQGRPAAAILKVGVRSDGQQRSHRVVLAGADYQTCLSEFGLEAHTPLDPGDDPGAFAGLLASLPSVTVMSLSVPPVVGEAVLAAGFPADLEALGMTIGAGPTGSAVDFQTLLLALPSGLVALHYEASLAATAALACVWSAWCYSTTPLTLWLRCRTATRA